MSEEDRPRFVWEKTKSKENILKTLGKIEKSEIEALEKSEKVKEYKENLSKLFDEGESNANIEDYKNTVLSMLKLQSKALKAWTSETFLSLQTFYFFCKIKISFIKLNFIIRKKRKNWNSFNFKFNFF